MYSINSTNRSLAELRSMQDWYLRYQLASVEGVSEVASLGGFGKQYQITVDPTRLRAYGLSISDVKMAVERSNGEKGGRSIELAEKEFILRVRGYIQDIEDLKKGALGVGDKGVPILLGEVGDVQLGPDMRRGIAELNGEGETVGGIVVVRYGANARQVILDVKKKLDQAMKGLPSDVGYTVAYDRSALIQRAVKTLEEKLIEEILVVALVCLAFLLHLRSALVAIVILPIAVLISFLVMFGQGISSNIMSLGGIAIAIGAMVDAVIIMIENAHKHLERDQGKKPHWEIIRDAAVPNAWIYVDVKGIDIGTYVQMAMRAVNDAVAKGSIKMPGGYTLFWSGRYEYTLRAKQRLIVVVPLTQFAANMLARADASRGPARQRCRTAHTGSGGWT